MQQQHSIDTEKSENKRQLIRQKNELVRDHYQTEEQRHHLTENFYNGAVIQCTPNSEMKSMNLSPESQRDCLNTSAHDIMMMAKRAI
jgi:hypothetical protein